MPIDPKAKITPEKLALLAKLRKTRGLEAARAGPSAKASSDPGELPLSFPEERSVRLLRLTGNDSLSRRIEDGLRVKGPLDASALERAFNHVLRRHDVLWSQYQFEGEQTQKRIAPMLEVRVPVADLLQLPESARLDAALDAIAKEVQVEIDITRDAPLLWLKVWRLGEQDHVLFLNAPHCVVDVDSFRFLWQELASAYQVLARGGQEPAETARPRQYAEFSRWQREWYQGGAEVARCAEFWQKRLAGCVPLNQHLPTEGSRAGIDRLRETSYLGGSPTAAFSWQTPPGLALELSKAARDWKMPLFMVAYAALAVLMARKSRLDDVTIGTLNNTRARIPGWNGVVGNFNNNGLLRVGVSGNPSYAEVLARARATVLEALSVPEFQLIPFVFPKFNDLFRVIFNYIGPERPPNWPGLELFGFPVSEVVRRGPPMRFHIDLLFRVSQPDEQTFRGTMIYNAGLWSPARTRAWADEYVNILQALVSDPQRSAEVSSP